MTASKGICWKLSFYRNSSFNELSAIRAEQNAMSYLYKKGIAERLHKTTLKMMIRQIMDEDCSQEKGQEEEEKKKCITS